MQEFLKKMKRVTIETSNLCPFTHHKKCPAQHITEKQTLPLPTIMDILQTLQWWDYKGQIAWHVYNEPMVDPRLMFFVMEAHRLLPMSELFIYTNGWNLTETLCGEMIDAGVSRWMITSYSAVEDQRILEVVCEHKDRAAFSFTPKGDSRGLDDRMALSEVDVTDKQIDGYKLCRAPLPDLTIRASGNIGLCCIDWAETVTFGNVKEKGFAKCVANSYEEMMAVQDELAVGIRQKTCCRQCRKHRKHAVLWSQP